MIIISQTPLRISFVGGGTDIKAFYNQYDGAVISTAIDRYIYVIVKSRKDTKIGLYYDASEIVDAPSQIRHELVREAMKMTGVEGGVDIIILSDVPAQGTGLGSSSSLTVGLLTALYEYQSRDMNVEDIARQACQIEIDILGSPIGKQDQYAAAYGGLNVIRFYMDETVAVEPVGLQKDILIRFFNQLFIVDTGLSRNAGDVLKKVKEDMPFRMEYLKEMALMPDQFKKALETENYDLAAECLRRAWDLKKTIGSDVTNMAVDIIYKDGLDSGAVAGKLLGAGAGGFMLFLVPTPAQEGFFTKMSKKYEIIPVKYEEGGSRILYCFRHSRG